MSGLDPQRAHPVQKALRVLLAVIVVALGLRAAAGEWAAISVWSPGTLEAALIESEDARVTRYLESTMPGGGALYLELRDRLPEDFHMFGMYPSVKECAADPGLKDQRTRARDLLANLRLLWFPSTVNLMPPVDWTQSPWTGIAYERLFALDLGYPNQASLRPSMEPWIETEGGTLWRYTAVEGKR